MDIVRIVVRKYPNLRRNLRISHLPHSPEQFVKRALFLALMISFTSAILTFFLFGKRLAPATLALLVPAVFALMYLFSANFILLSPLAYIRRRQRDIDKDALFAGRFLLVKMESGAPLYNSLIDASRSYGVAGKYFKEIVDEVNAGVPLERALERARQDTPSERFRRILWQVLLALKTGTDISSALRNTLHSITADEIIDIKAYGKKLNSVLLFYMVIACVAPSLGMTMFFILTSIVGIQITTPLLFLFLFLFGMVQMSFIFVIRSIRPMVDL